MEVISRCALRALGVVYRAGSGAFAQVVIVKATYVLRPGESVLAPEQDELVEEDNHWDDEPTRSVYVPSDRAPYKPKADAMLVGHAFAKGKKPAYSIPARLVVGELDKSLEVWCDRGFSLPKAQLLVSGPLLKMPLRWERAAGGPETNNPVGIRFDGPPDRYGMVAFPNLQPPGTHLSQRTDTFAPVCFAPVAESWPSRAQLLGKHAETLRSRDWEVRPLPEDLDYGYFQAAPLDQQVSELRANERIVLENLHPEHERLVTSLPGIRPKAVVERATGEREEITFAADTLWIDTDRGVCTLVWRGRIGLRQATEAGTITISIAERVGEPDIVELDDADVGGEPASVPGSSTLEVRDEAVMTMMVGFGSGAQAGPVMPFLGKSQPSGSSASSSPAARPNDGVLPFGRGAGVSAPIARPPEPTPSIQGTIAIPPSLTGETRSKPALSGPPPLPSPAPAPPAVVPPVMSPPPMVVPPPRIEPIPPPVVASPWASGSQEVVPAPVSAPLITPVSPTEAPKRVDVSPVLVLPKAEPEVVPIQDEAAAKRGWKPVGVRSGNGSKGPPLSPNPLLGGAAAASDAAAAASGRKDAGDQPAGKGVTAPFVSPPKAVIELLWYDPPAMPRIRRQAGWKEILGQLKGKAFDDELSGDSPPEKRQEVRDRRDVAGLLARGDAEDMAGIEAALANAVTEDGTFVAPLVLLAGELEFPFDELETLKATMAALTPLASGDKRLKETLDTTEELMKTPWLKGATGIAEGLTAKLKEVYAQGNRMLPPRYLESHTERMLLEQRAYQKRTVMGKVCIRSLLSVPGAQGSLPVYLPENLRQELPSIQRFIVRLIAEVRGKVDQYEGQDVAVRGIGVGKVVPTISGRRT